MMDPEYWKDPDVFRPERFISEDGKLKREERFIPFGKGIFQVSIYYIKISKNKNNIIHLNLIIMNYNFVW